MEKEKLIKISENDWHFKLIKYVWRINPKMFRNLCPYFWLTIASLFCCPFAVVLKSLKKLWDVFYDFDQVNYTKRLSKEQIYYQYYYLKNGYSATWEGLTWGGLDPKYFSEVTNKLKKYDNPKDFLKELGLSEKKVLSFKSAFEKKLNLEKAKSKQKKSKKEERDKRIKESMYKVADTSKFLAKVLGVIFFCFLGNFGCWIISNIICWGIYTGKGANILLAIFCSLGLLLVTLVLVWFAGKFESDWKKNLKNLTIMEYLYVIPFLIIYIPVRIIFVSILWNILYKFLWEIIILGILTGFKEGIIEFTGIFGDYLNASYSDYCPMISWKEED